MQLKLIGCNVFQREAFWCMAQSPHVIDAEFTEVGEHAQPDLLRASLQARIDAADASPKGYDAILLLYGLCGAATVGLEARKTRVVLPRAHDCCTILLGSRAKFRAHFEQAPSTPFASSGYIERGDYLLRAEETGRTLRYGDAYAALVEQYGEEDAQYLWEAMHPERRLEASARAVFIDVPETAGLGHAERFRAQAEADGREYVRLEGNLRLIRDLVNGRWSPDEFLALEPGQRLAGVYDWEEIVRAESQENHGSPKA